jgi:hypothetical protein
MALTTIEFPDPSICKTTFYITDYWGCMVNRSKCQSCSYAYEIVGVYFCKHPSRSEFEKKKWSG